MAVSIGSIITRTYDNFAGVDFLNQPNSVNLHRSPDALNVWKSYNKEQANIIESRPGFIEVVEAPNKSNINNIFFMDNDAVFIHSGEALYLYPNFPLTTGMSTIASKMANKKSIMARFNDWLYVVDGKTYFRLKLSDTKQCTIQYLASIDSNIKPSISATTAYIPTTTISRTPARRWRSV